MTTKVSKSLTRQPRAPSEHRDGRQHLHDPLRPQSPHLPRSHVLYNGKTAANNVQTTENTTQKTTEKIIRILKERPYTTAGQLAEELGLTVDGVDYNIRKLKKQGRIVRIGGDKGGHWEINEK